MSMRIDAKYALSASQALFLCCQHLKHYFASCRELNDNHLTGHIPPELGKLTELFDLYVSVPGCSILIARFLLYHKHWDIFLQECR